MLGVATIEAPKDYKFDGVSPKLVLPGVTLAPRKLFRRIGGLSSSAKSLDCGISSKVIRDGRWKLVAMSFYKKVMLYDFEKDLGESMICRQNTPNARADEKRTDTLGKLDA